MSREVIWDGKTYPSIAAAARAEGVPYPTMCEWIAAIESTKTAAKDDKIKKNGGRK